MYMTIENKPLIREYYKNSTLCIIHIKAYNKRHTLYFECTLVASYIMLCRML